MKTFKIVAALVIFFLTASVIQSCVSECQFAYRDYPSGGIVIVHSGLPAHHRTYYGFPSHYWNHFCFQSYWDMFPYYGVTYHNHHHHPHHYHDNFGNPFHPHSPGNYQARVSDTPSDTPGSMSSNQAPPRRNTTSDYGRNSTNQNSSARYSNGTSTNRTSTSTYSRTGNRSTGSSSAASARSGGDSTGRTGTPSRSSAGRTGSSGRSGATSRR